MTQPLGSQYAMTSARCTRAMTIRMAALARSLYACSGSGAGFWCHDILQLGGAAAGGTRMAPGLNARCTDSDSGIAHPPVRTDRPPGRSLLPLGGRMRHEEDRDYVEPGYTSQ